MNRMKYSSDEKGNIEKRHKIGFSPRGKKNENETSNFFRR